jgi:hypothetical protein
VFRACREQQRAENGSRQIMWRALRCRSTRCETLVRSLVHQASWVHHQPVGQVSPVDVSLRRSGVSARQKRWVAADKADK